VHTLRNTSRIEAKKEHLCILYFVPMLLLEQDIPEFVRSSPYLKSLLENGPFPEAGIEIPEGCAKKASVLETEFDLLQILWTLRFWLLTDCCDAPKCLFQYAFDPAHKEIMLRICLEYGREFSFLANIARIIAAKENHFLQNAIACGCMTIVQYLCEEQQVEVTVNELAMAATVDRVECLQYLHSLGHPLTSELAHIATCCGRSNVLNYLHQNGIEMDEEMAAIAATTGRVECLRYCLDVSSFPVIGSALPRLLAAAAWGGMVTTLEFLWTRFAEYTTVAENEWVVLFYAAQRGHTDVLKFGHSHQFAAFHEHASAAILVAKVVCAGKVQCLDYLYSVGLTGAAEDVSRAVVKGHLQCVRYLLAHNCPFTINICYASCEHNQLDVLQWAHENGQPWHRDCCHIAASKGHLECLKYAREHGCPWGENLSVYAACAPTADCLRYVVEQGAALAVETARVAAQHSSLACLQYLHSMHCPWDATVCEEAAAAGSLECLRYLHESGCPWDQRTANAAAVRAQSGASECLQYIQQLAERGLS